MIKSNKLIIMCLSALIVFLIPSINNAYGFWDQVENTNNETLSIGTWDFLTIGPDFTTDFQTWIDNILANDPSSDFGYIYTQTDVTNNTVITTLDIDVFGYTWDFWGKGKTNNYSTMGYPVLIDRTLESGIAIHDINPGYFITSPYLGYNYFTAYDAMNTLTNNTYSLRLNYNNRMTTTTPVGQVTNISLYAMVGLSDPDDPIIIRDNQKLYVEVSTNGSNWTKIGTDTPSQVSSSSEDFTFYSYDVPSNLLGQDLYVRLRYNGRALNFNGFDAYGRLIIDELIITTN